MGSDFDSRYRQAAADRVRSQAATQSAADAALSQIERARGLAGPVIAEFTTFAVKVLRHEGVWCRNGWPLPGIGQDIDFTLDGQRSGLFRKVWGYKTSYGFLWLTKGGSLRLTSSPAGDGPDDSVYARMAVGGQDALRSVRSKYESDSNGIREPTLFFNTGSSSLTLVWENRSGRIEVKPFMDYGAEAVESLVAGWRNRKH